jgi:hypothetical protein
MRTSAFSNWVSRLATLIRAGALSQALLAVPAGANTPVQTCVLGNSSKANVTISSCQYHLIDSPAGAPNYFLVVEVTYGASRSLSAVRFAFDVDGAKSYMVARQSVQPGTPVSYEFKLVSPKTSVTKVVCSADQATS